MYPYIERELSQVRSRHITRHMLGYRSRVFLARGSGGVIENAHKAGADINAGTALKLVADKR